MTAAIPPSLAALQIGGGWFPEAPGGLERVFHALAMHLPDAGVATRGLVVGSPAVAAASGGRVTAFAPAQAPILTRWRAARRALRHEIGLFSSEVIAAHFALYAFPVLDLLAGRPLVVHFHGPWADESAVEGAAGSRIRRALERAVYARASRFVVLSEAFAAVLRERYGVPGERIAVVPGGVALERFGHGTREEARLALGWPLDRPLILTVRRLTARMGVDRLVEAMQAASRAVPEALLLVAGDGPLRAPLAEQVRAAGLERNVRLLGFLPEDHLPLAYRAADLSVVPTRALEGFGLVAAESLAAGTPVLVTPVGGLPEVVRPLSENLVLEGCETHHLAEGLVAALTGARQLPSAAACRSHAEAHFGWPLAAARVRAVYEEARAW
jgi:glycogen synthase